MISSNEFPGFLRFVTIYGILVHRSLISEVEENLPDISIFIILFYNLIIILFVEKSLGIRIEYSDC